VGNQPRALNGRHEQRPRHRHGRHDRRPDAGREHVRLGRKTTLTIHLTKHGKPAKGVRVLIKGPKLKVTTKRSNAKGA
jgi:hypothetical protein